MKKNLKKVISAIAALALSASSFVAFAVDFPDVADSANYAQAVDELSSMGVVIGNPDGTFGSDQAVTRAEITTMIIRGMNKDEAAQSMAGTVRYSDVAAGDWESGYVAYASTATPQFIVGNPDGTFAPNDTVTYNEALTMLVRAAGYEVWAQNSGQAWPASHTSIAGQVGITAGIGNVGGDTPLTRGQVAILVANTLIDTPILGEGETQATWNGGYTIVPEQKNGTDPDETRFWTTMAIRYHDVYKVTGRVTETNKSNSGIRPDEVQFEVLRSSNFDGEYYPIKGATGGKQYYSGRFGVTDTKAADYLQVQATALIRKVDDDEYDIISFFPSGASEETDPLPADLFASEYYGRVDGNNKDKSKTLYFYNDENKSSSNVKRYPLAKYLSGNDSDVEWYINDVKFGGEINDDFINKYLVNNTVGTVQLVDYQGQNNNSPDGYYDSVRITYYVDAIVSDLDTSRSNPRIYFDRTATGLDDSYAELMIDDDSKSYDFYLDGQKVDYTEIQPDDVISLAWNVVGSARINGSDFITGYISRNVQSGEVSYIDTAEGEYTVGSEVYELNKGMYGNTNPGIETGVEYTFYLDYFGYVVDHEEGATSKTYGVLDAVFAENGSRQYRATIIEADGSVNTYDFRNQENATVAQGYLRDAGAANQYTTDTTAADYVQSLAGMDYPQYRVVDYTINSSGQIRIKEQVAPAVGGTAQEYRESQNRAGDVRMNDNTVALDLVDYYADGTTGNIGLVAFEDEVEYTAYGFGKVTGDNTYRFVLVLDGNTGITVNSPMAVLKSTGETTDKESGSTLVNLKVLTNGEETTLAISDDAKFNWNTEYSKIGIGGAFLYVIDGKNQITDIMPVMSMPDNIYTATIGAALTAGSDKYVDGEYTFADQATFLQRGEWGGVWTKANKKQGPRNADAYFDFGPVIENGRTITLGTVEQYADRYDGHHVTTLNGTDHSYSFADGAYVYTYDYNESRVSNRMEASGTGAVRESRLNLILVQPTTGGDYYDWDGANNTGDHAGDISASVNYALLKVVDDDIAVGYAILGN